MAVARFMVARLTLGSLPEVFLVSRPSVRCGLPWNNRCIAARSASAVAADTPSLVIVRRCSDWRPRQGLLGGSGECQGVCVAER
jgi:hypothetical protein